MADHRGRARRRDAAAEARYQKLCRSPVVSAILTVVALAVVWQAAHALILRGSFFPSAAEVGRSLLVGFQQGKLLPHTVASLQRVTVGFLAAGITGIALGLAAGQTRFIRRLVTAIVEILRPIPPIAWIPIAILAFGLGDSAAYFIVFLGAFFPIFTNTYFGARSLPSVYKNIARSFEVGPWFYVSRILFFHSLPAIFVGLKIGLGMAWMSVIAAELIGAQSGLGYFIEINRLLLRTDNIVAGMILIGLTGAVLISLLAALEKVVIPWRS